MLPNTHGTPVPLAGLRGAPALLVLLPYAFSRTCTSELGELRDGLGSLEATGVRVLAVSCDPVPALRAWAEQERVGLDLLSDFWPHGAAARALGAFDEVNGVARRGSFLLDAGGVLRWSVLGPSGRARPFDAYRAAVADLVG
ncbi:redoxin domain-containing protein [Cellulomonas marina]|uniref:redoxin domain-containing protein n=1 Tax=Cellulomonas marina TaxID=988821 RepID=UPI00313FF836